MDKTGTRNNRTRRRERMRKEVGAEPWGHQMREPGSGEGKESSRRRSVLGGGGVMRSHEGCRVLGPGEGKESS